MYLVQILLPLFDNQGAPIPAEEFQRVSTELSERFGGLTAFTRSPAEGIWKKDRSETKRDDIVVVEVMAGDLDRAFWTERRRELETRFRQDVVVIRAHPIEQI